MTPLGLPSTASVALAPAAVGPFVPAPRSGLADLDWEGLRAAYKAVFATHRVAKDAVVDILESHAALVAELEALAPKHASPDTWRAFAVAWMMPLNDQTGEPPAYNAMHFFARLCRAIVSGLPPATREDFMRGVVESVPRDGALFCSALVAPLVEHVNAHFRALSVSPPAFPRGPLIACAPSAGGVAIDTENALEFTMQMLALLYDAHETVAAETQAELAIAHRASPRARAAFAAEAGAGAGPLRPADRDGSAPLLGAVAGYARFYCDALATISDTSLLRQYDAWVAAGRTRTPGAPTVCAYPFLLPPSTKRRMLTLAAARAQQMEAVVAAQRAALGLAPPGDDAAEPFFVLTVRRDHLLSDTLNRIAATPPAAFRKRLKVVFAGEDAIDAGGVAKEFFQLVVRELLDDRWGLWASHADSRAVWLHPACPADAGREVFLVGVLLGLALYNSILLDVPFPLALYKKLLGAPVGLVDLRSVSPALAAGIQAVAEYPGDDVEDIFGLTFSAAYDAFGERVVVDLVPGGRDVPVTAGNRDDFVAKYVDWHLNGSIAAPFAALRAGFFTSASTDVVHLLRAEELELLVTGTPRLNLHALERVATYEGGYAAEHPTVRAFWRVVHSFPEPLQKKLLLFATGSANAPIGGLAALPFRVQRAGPDTDLLPTAATCFNTLLLPEYGSEDKLRDRLTVAISECAGFGLR
jgi:ubiquitin-protein ligase E3 A